MNFIDKLEKKFPRFGISYLMRYVISLNIVGAVIGLIDASGFLPVQIYADFLSLDFYKILHGQIWRLVTFILYPVYDFSSSSMFINLVWFAVWAFLYFQIGIALERNWGRFRFTLFYLGGIVFVILVTFVFFIVNCALSGVSVYGGGQASMIGYLIGNSASLEYLNQTLFLAYALMFPEVRFLIYFLIPVKAKWLAYVYLALMGFQFIMFIISGYYYGVVLILGALLNFVIFFVFGRGTLSMSGRMQQNQRRREFQRKMSGHDSGQYNSVRFGTGQFGRHTRPKEVYPGGSARHKCAICGRTENDDPTLEFRYCSKCNGNYEYCSDHLFSHEHVV